MKFLYILGMMMGVLVGFSGLVTSRTYPNRKYKPCFRLLERNNVSVSLEEEML